VNPWLLLVLLAGAAAVWLLARPPAVFVVRIREGQPRPAQGTVTPAFLALVRQLCEDHGLQAAEIRGVPRGPRISLWFSRGVPAAFRQQLRNWWATSGWPAPPRYPRRQG